MPRGVVLEEGLGAGISVSDLREHVLQAAQHEIGRLWQENIVTIAQEHMATAIAGLVLTQLFDRAEPQPRNGKSVMVACVEGELHDLPARLVADTLDLAGFSVQFVGADVPADALASLAASKMPDLIALSATMAFHVPSLKKTVAHLRERFGRSIPLAVGGGALAWTPSLSTDLDVDIAARSADDLVQETRRLLGVA